MALWRRISRGLTNRKWWNSYWNVYSLVINNRLEGDIHKETPDDIENCNRVRRKEITGRDFLFNYCDEKFWEDELSEEGLAFTKSYYSNENGEYGQYISDYEETLGKELDTLYHVEDSWGNYSIIANVIDARFKEWKKNKYILTLLHRLSSYKRSFKLLLPSQH